MTLSCPQALGLVCVISTRSVGLTSCKVNTMVSFMVARGRRADGAAAAGVRVRVAEAGADGGRGAVHGGGIVPGTAFTGAAGAPRPGAGKGVVGAARGVRARERGFAGGGRPGAGRGDRGAWGVPGAGVDGRYARAG